MHKCVCTYIHTHTHTKTPQKKFRVQRESRSFHSQKRFKAYMFGVHIGAFHGGVMRIENTEITRSGQVEGADILAGYSGPEESKQKAWVELGKLAWSCYDSMYHVSCLFSCAHHFFQKHSQYVCPCQAANFGRYSSHWHVLSPHRTVDVADLASLLVRFWCTHFFQAASKFIDRNVAEAYLRNNSYHDTFQRAVVAASVRCICGQMHIIHDSWLIWISDICV